MIILTFLDNSISTAHRGLAAVSPEETISGPLFVNHTIPYQILSVFLQRSFYNLNISWGGGGGGSEHNSQLTCFYTFFFPAPPPPRIRQWSMRTVFVYNYRFAHPFPNDRHSISLVPPLFQAPEKCPFLHRKSAPLTL